MKEAIISVLTSPAAFSVYGTLGLTAVMFLVNKYLSKEKARKVYSIALSVAKEVEDETIEGTRVDNFLDSVIERVEKELGRTPNEKEIEKIKKVKEQVKKK